jgi:hypothetical protein
MFMKGSMNPTPTDSVAAPELIARIIFALCQTLTARLRVGSVTPAGLTYIVGRLLGIRKRFRTLVERIGAGKMPAERARKPRPAKVAPDPEFPLGFRPPPPGWRRWAVRADKPVPLWQSLRQKFAWLLTLAPSVPEFRDSAVAHREDIRRLLEAPEMRALFLASRRVGDSLRPLCWMLGIEAALLYPARPAARDAVSTPGPSVPAPEVASPTADQDAASAVAMHRPIVPAVMEPPSAWPRAGESDDFFAMA